MKRREIAFGHFRLVSYSILKSQSQIILNCVLIGIITGLAAKLRADGPSCIRIKVAAGTLVAQRSGNIDSYSA